MIAAERRPPRHPKSAARRRQQRRRPARLRRPYRALHRLERRKWIAAAWKVSDNKQRTRVYRLTAEGRRQLASERSKWAQLVEAMAGILNGTRRSDV